MLYKDRKIIFCDIDGTLKIGNKYNRKLINWLKGKYRDGYKIYTWSMRGKKYAEKHTNLAGVSKIIEESLSKPCILVDDEGWHWAKSTKVINPTDILGSKQ